MFPSRCFIRKGTAAPGGDGNPRLFGDPLGSNLVSQSPHRFGIRTEEENPSLRQASDKFRILSHETPTRPDGIHFPLAQDLEQPVMVEIGGHSPGFGLQLDGEIGITNERRIGIRGGIESNNF